MIHPAKKMVDFKMIIKSLLGKTKDSRATYLIGRTIDKKACLVKGIPNEITETALDIIIDSFSIPKNLKFCFKLDDKLKDIYDCHDTTWGDILEFETLFMHLKKITKTDISKAMGTEIINSYTVQDIINYIHSNNYIHPTQPAP